MIKDIGGIARRPSEREGLPVAYGSEYYLQKSIITDEDGGLVNRRQKEMTRGERVLLYTKRYARGVDLWTGGYHSKYEELEL